jgi:hypothetical protein
MYLNSMKKLKKKGTTEHTFSNEDIKAIEIWGFAQPIHEFKI